MRLEIHVDITIIIKKPVLVDLGVSLELLAIDVATNSLMNYCLLPNILTANCQID